MVQLSVLDRTRAAPPASPTDGDRHIVASGATGLWAGWDLNVAFWVDGVWMRLVPRPGWLAWIADEAVFAVWNGSSWDPVGEPVDVSDAVFSLVNDANPTKKALFSLSGISTGTTRTVTLPNTSSELAILAGTQTFSGNKTFSGTLTASGTVTVSAAAATIGTATTTATYGMGTGATTTGVTKTVNLGTGGASGSTTVVNIGSATSGSGGMTVVNTPTVTFANAVTQVGMPQANLTAQLLGLGGATADSYNRLSMNTPAVLINNAGVALGGNFDEVSTENFDWLMGINFDGVVCMSRAFLPLLKQRPAARIVNISSLFGFVTPAGQTAYCASKFAVRGFSNALRLELHGGPVGVTVVHPGGVATAIATSARAPDGGDPAEHARKLKQAEKLLRMPPSRAAQIILQGIEKDKPRVIVGNDARILSWLERLMPVNYWRLLPGLATQKTP